MSDLCGKCKSPDNLKRCSRCRALSYCSRECQVADWKTHKPHCEPMSGSDPIKPVGYIQEPSSQEKDAKNTDGKDLTHPRLATGADPNDPIYGVELLPRPRNNQKFSPECFVPWQCNRDHDIFRYGELCPFTVLYGIPIIIISKAIHGRNFQREPGPNQPAVYLRIEVVDGFAPVHWQMDNPDHCYAIRRDKQPLSRDVLETMYAFHASLLSSDYFENGMFGRGPPSYPITPAVYEKFANKYWEQQKKQGRELQSRGDGR